MPIRNIATLAVAIFLGLIAVVIVRNYVGSVRQGGPVANLATVPVVIAALPVARGAQLQPSMLKIVAFPQDAIPAGAFPDLAQVTGAKEGPRVALRALAVNEPLGSANVSAPGARPNLSEALDSGMRAVSLKSDEIAGVAGFVLPGDRVDVLLTRSVAGQKTDEVTQAVAENVLVLGVDQSDNNQATKPAVAKAVTVEVTPDQAELISLGQAVGEVSLALRRPADGAPLAHRAMTVDDLSEGLPRKKPAPAVVRVVQRPAQVVPPAAPEPPPVVVRVVRGVDPTLYSGTDTSLTAVTGQARGFAGAVARPLANAAAAIPAAARP